MMQDVMVVAENTIPKGYKNSALGVIPEDWEIMYLDEVAYIDNNNLKGNTDNNYQFEYISLSDVHSNEFNIKSTVQIFGSAPSRARRIVKKDDILMSTVRPNLQGFLILRDNIKDVIASTGFAVISPRICNNEFIYHYLFSDYISKQFHQLLVGSNYPAINSSDVRKLKIVFPLDVEQKAIADCLSTWDKTIEKLNQLIAQKELRKKGLMQELLTGKKRLRGFEKTSWIKVAAGEVFKNISVKGFSDEDLLSSTQDKGIIPRSMLSARVTMPTGDTMSFKLVEKGDFVISLRSFQGGLEYSYYRGVVSPAYTVLKPRKKINDEFYKQYFKSYDFIGHLAVAVIGIRDGKQISYDDFCFVRIPFPSYEEQTAISDLMQSTDKEIQLLKNKLDQLKIQKKGLMQVLLTGKKRLKY